MTSEKKEQYWRRSKQTTELIHQIRNTIKSIGFEEEIAITPLANEYSVLARKGEVFFNVRVSKNSLEVISQDELSYNVKRGVIRQVFRR